jgi:hypothetical protein
LALRSATIAASEYLLYRASGLGHSLDRLYRMKLGLCLYPYSVVPQCGHRRWGVHPPTPALIVAAYTHCPHAACRQEQHQASWAASQLPLLLQVLQPLLLQVLQPSLLAAVVS